MPINTKHMTPEQYVEHIRSRTVISNSGCWLFQGYQNGDGYCQVPYKGERWQLTRLMYTLLVGPIQDGMLMCHKCDVRHCWNPDHLYQGTFKDNAQDCIQRGRHADQVSKTCINGHEWNEENTRYVAAGKQCRVCERIRQRIDAGWPDDLARTLPPQKVGHSPLRPNYRREQSRKSLPDERSASQKMRDAGFIPSKRTPTADWQDPDFNIEPDKST